MLLKEKFPVHQILDHKNYPGKGRSLAFIVSLDCCLIPLSQKNLFFCCQLGKGNDKNSDAVLWWAWYYGQVALSSHKCKATAKRVHFFYLPPHPIYPSLQSRHLPVKKLRPGDEIFTQDSKPTCDQGKTGATGRVSSSPVSPLREYTHLTTASSFLLFKVLPHLHHAFYDRSQKCFFL